MSPQDFEKIARQALERLPPDLKPYVEECLLIIEPCASRQILQEMGIAEDEDLFGLYEGPALTERHVDDPPDLPPRITLFYEPFLESYESEEELIHEIQVTVLHEIGHHFGLDEERLEELGYG